jgi:N-methylhydantoinase B
MSAKARTRGAKRGGLDPITLEVIRNRLLVIADEMELTLLKSAFSSIIKEALDASAAVFDREANTIAQASAIPTHLGSLIPAVRKIIELYDADMRDGDIFVLNDPYRGGTHLPDVSVICPVFHGRRRVAFTASIAHHQDMGGKSPGSTPPDSTEIYAEGLIIPPLKLYRAGVRNSDVFAFIASNVRVGEMVVGDVEAQVACALIGRRRLREMCDEYGADITVRAFAALQDHAERLTRESLATAPRGRFEFVDYLDDNGIDHHQPVKIAVALTFDDAGVHVDFTDTDPATKGALNCVPSSTLAGVYYAIRAVCAPHVPINEGVHRAITTVLPVGSLVNPLPPAPVAARTLTIRRIVSVMMGALAKAFPGRVPAACDGQSNFIYVGGSDPEAAQRYVALLGIPTSGGTGGRSGKDGIDVVSSDTSNLIRYPIEAFESETPLRVNFLELWTDSCGAGRYRGGLGYHAEVELLRGDAVLTHRRDRHDFAPWGLHGGLAAPCCRTIIHRRDAASEEMPSKFITPFRAGDRIEIFTSGGGGYGDPLERPSAAVLEDFANRRVSARAAEEAYGVVLTDALDAVDPARTEALRTRLRQERGPVTWTFDRGPEYAARLGKPRFE